MLNFFELITVLWLYKNMSFFSLGNSQGNILEVKIHDIYNLLSNDPGEKCLYVLRTDRTKCR